MVKLRLARAGAKKRPYYRIIVTDSRNPRDGSFIEQIGTYDPLKTADAFALNADRLQYWIKVGGQLSDTLRTLWIKQQKMQKAAV